MDQTPDFAALLTVARDCLHAPHVIIGRADATNGAIHDARRTETGGDVSGQPANRWRLPLLLVGILFACGRRTVTTWLRAVDIRDDYADYYYFLSSLGRKTELLSTRLFLLLLRVLPLPDRLLAQRLMALAT